MNQFQRAPPNAQRHYANTVPPAQHLYMYMRNNIQPLQRGETKTDNPATKETK
jgi:hypothetical protein